MLCEVRQHLGAQSLPAVRQWRLGSDHLVTGCVYCNPNVYNGHAYHANACPTVTNVYPARPGQVCAECAQPMDYYTHIEHGRMSLCACLGCAALAFV